MKTRKIEVSGFSGKYSILIPENGEHITFDTDVSHGDWKTTLVFPDRWPKIAKGTEVEVVGHMQNLYGVHIKVKHKDSVYDVPVNRILDLKSKSRP